MSDVPPITGEALLGHAAFLRRLARELVRDEHAADDLVQETWAIALERGLADPTPRRAWLATVLRRLAFRSFRSRSRRTDRERRHARSETLGPASEAVEREELLRRVTEAVLALDEPLRTAVLLRYYEGLDSDAIGARIGAPSATVRGRLARAREQLRRRFDAECEGRRSWAPALLALAGEEPEAGMAPASTSTSAQPVALAVAGGLALVCLAAWIVLAPLQNAPSSPEAGAVELATADRRSGEATEVAAAAAAPTSDPSVVAETRRTAVGSPPSEPAPSDPRGFNGRLFDEETRAPIAGATIRTPRSRGLQVRELHATSDEQGRFRVEGEYPEIVEVLAEGFGVVLLTLPPAGPDPSRRVDVLLRRAASLEIELRGLPFAGPPAEIRLSASPWAVSYDGQFGGGNSFLLLRSYEWTVKTDAGGRASLSGLPPRAALQVELVTAAMDVPRRLPDVALDPGEVRRLTWDVRPRRMLGRAMGQGHGGLQGADICLHPRDSTRDSGPRGYLHPQECYDSFASAQTDAAGRFVLDGVSPGAWWLGIDPRASETLGARFPSAVVAVDVPIDAPMPQIELELPADLRMEGTVLDPAGVPMAEATVLAILDRTGASISADTNAEGRFRIGPLLEGEHELFALHDGHSFSERVRAVPGARDVVLRLPQGGTLSGECVDASTGTPVRAELRIAGAGSEFVMLTGTDETGGFEVSGLAIGSYDVVASSADGRFGAARDVPVGAGAGDAPVRIELVAVSVLQVLHRGTADSLTIELRRDGRLFAWAGASRGSAVRVAVPPAVYELEVHGPDGKSSVRIVEVGAEETTVEIVDP